MTRTGQTDPHSGRHIVLDLPSGPIAALRAGADGAPDVLLVPGYTGSKEDFVPILDPLAQAGLRVTAIDLPGQHESPGPDDPAQYTPEALAGRLVEISDRLGAPPHLLGHSFGGLVARAAVIRAPRRFADLVLMSSGPAAIGGSRRERVEQLRPVLPEAGLAGVWAAMQAAYLAEPGYVPPPPDLAEFLERRFMQGNPAMLLGMGDAISSEPDRVDELRAAGVRTLVIYGAADDAWPPAVQAEMARRLGAAHVEVPHAAHSPAAENPVPTARALVEFWQAS